MARAEPSGISLTEADAAIVKGMLARGDRQHDIAAWFGVNGGRIGNMSTGAKFSKVSAASPEKLPPPGPYLTGRDAYAAMLALEAAAETINTALLLIRERAAPAFRPLASDFAYGRTATPDNTLVAAEANQMGSRQLSD